MSKILFIEKWRLEPGFTGRAELGNEKGNYTDNVLDHVRHQRTLEG